MKTAIVTGSESFGKYITNPTKWLTLYVDGKEVAGFKIHSLVFPSVVVLPQGIENHGELIVKKAQEVNAQIIISFGMASEVKGFRIERTGVNWIFNEKYLSPSENNQPLDPSRPEKEQLKTDLSFWDLEKMQKLFLESNIPFESNISDDAGQYSCNGWIYRTLRAMKSKNLNIPYLFIHSACTEEAIELIEDFDRVNKQLNKKEEMLNALEIILQSYKL